MKTQKKLKLIEIFCVSKSKESRWNDQAVSLEVLNAKHVLLAVVFWRHLSRNLRSSEVSQTTHVLLARFFISLFACQAPKNSSKKGTSIQHFWLQIKKSTWNKCESLKFILRTETCNVYFCLFRDFYFIFMLFNVVKFHTIYVSVIEWLTGESGREFGYFESFSIFSLPLELVTLNLD